MFEQVNPPSEMCLIIFSALSLWGDETLPCIDPGSDGTLICPTAVLTSLLPHVPLS